MATDEIDELLTLEEAAKILRVTPGTLRRWDRTGHFKAVRVGVRRGVGDRRYKRQDVENYLKDNK